MTRSKTQVEKINALLELLADVNHILANPYTQSDRFQQMQYDRQKQQYLSQLADLLATSTKPLVVSEKRANNVS
jgi:hypothetical protein